MRQGHLDHPPDGESTVGRQAVPSLGSLDMVGARKRTLGVSPDPTARPPGHNRIGERQHNEHSFALDAKPRSWWTAAETHWLGEGQYGSEERPGKHQGLTATSPYVFSPINCFLSEAWTGVCVCVHREG